LTVVYTILLIIFVIQGYLLIQLSKVIWKIININVEILKIKQIITKYLENQRVKNERDKM